MGQSVSNIETRESPLQAELLVVPHPDSSCSVYRRSKSGERVNQNIVFPEGGEADGRCCAEVTIEEEGEGERQLVSNAVEEHCICPVLSQADCVFSVEKVDEDGMHLSITVPDREGIQALVSVLKDRSSSVKLRRLSQLERDENDEPIELEADAITPKQRQTVELAVELGYYDVPRRTDLEELADKLEISRSAVSQRLNRAESKLVRKLHSVDNR